MKYSIYLTCSTDGNCLQVTAFLGKSTSKWVPIRHIWLLAVLQSINCALLFVHALWPFLPNVWVMFALVLYEGFIAGAIYVNAFFLVRTQISENLREFALQVTRLVLIRAFIFNLVLLVYSL